MDQVAFEYIRKEIVCGDLDNMRQPYVMQALYARIIKSFAICCRLSFFNKQNPKTKNEKLKTVKSYMKSEVYKTAFRRIKLNKIEWKLWLVVIAGRIKSPRLLYFLHLLQNGKR